jgi:hypothetical protein
MFSPQPFQNTIPAGDLRQFKKAIDSYLSRNKRPLICFEGMDLCISESGVEDVINLLESVKREITYKSGVLVLIMRRNSVEPKVWGALEKLATVTF